MQKIPLWWEEAGCTCSQGCPRSFHEQGWSPDSDSEPALPHCSLPAQGNFSDGVAEVCDPDLCTECQPSMRGSASAVSPGARGAQAVTTLRTSPCDTLGQGAEPPGQFWKQDIDTRVPMWS